MLSNNHFSSFYFMVTYLKTIYKLVSYVILAVAIFVHNKGSLNSTYTSHKTHERLTMLTEIQLDIYDTTIVRIKTFAALWLAHIADINTL